MMKIPIFLFNGLLESGKTFFIDYMLKKPVFADGQHTVVICCEEGIENYDLEYFKAHHIHLVSIEEEAEFNDALLQKLYKEYHPARVLIEYNGMWDVSKPFEMDYPKDWFLYEVMVLVNAETYSLYMNNMRSIMAAHFGCCDLVIINRVDENTPISNLRGTVKSINPSAKLYECDTEFQMIPLKESLPYNINSKVIEISMAHYPIWYIDIWEHPGTYSGKTVKVSGLFFQQPTDPKDCFSLGRFSMPCCAEDIILLGVYCHNIGKPRFNNKDSVEVTGEIRYESAEVYGGEKGPVIYVKSIALASQNQEVLIDYNEI